MLWMCKENWEKTTKNIEPHTMKILPCSYEQSNLRAKTMLERPHLVDNQISFEIAALFHSPTVVYGGRKSAAISKLIWFSTDQVLTACCSLKNDNFDRNSFITS